MFVNPAENVRDRAFAVAAAVEDQGQLHVLDDGERGDEVEELEDEPDLATA